MKHKLHRVLSVTLVFCMMMSFIPAIQPAEADVGFTWKTESYSKDDPNATFMTHTCTSSPSNITMTVPRMSTASLNGQLHLSCSVCGAIAMTEIPQFGLQTFNVTTSPESFYDGQPHTLSYETKDGPFQSGASERWSKDLFLDNGKVEGSYSKTHAGVYGIKTRFRYSLRLTSQAAAEAQPIYDEIVDFGRIIIRPKYASISSFPEHQYITDGTTDNNILAIWRNITMPGIDGTSFTLDSYIYKANKLAQDGVESAANWNTDNGASALTSITSPGVYVVDLVIPKHGGDEVKGYVSDYQIDPAVTPARTMKIYKQNVYDLDGVTLFDTPGIGYGTYLIVSPDKVGPLYVGDDVNTVLTEPVPNTNGFSMTVYEGANNENANITARAGTYHVPIKFNDTNTGVGLVGSAIDVEVKKWEADHIEPIEAAITCPVGTALDNIPFPNVTVISKPRSDRPASRPSTFRNVPAAFYMKQGTTYDPYSTEEQTVYGSLVLPGSDFEEMLSDPDHIEFSVKVRLQANDTASCTFDDVTKPYTGQPVSHEISDSVGIESATYTYEGIDGTSYGPSAAPPSEMGTYRVTATLTMGPGFAQIGPLTAKLTISKGLQFLPANAVDPKLQAADFTTITLQEPPADPYGGTYEFAWIVDGEPRWQDERTFTGLLPDTAYTFVQRLKATATKDASTTSKEAVFRTRDFDMSAAVTATKTTATVPDTVTLTANCTHGLGSDPSIVLSYQWFRNGIAIDGETGETITLRNPEQSGFYSCTITLTKGTTVKTAESNQVRVTISAKNTVMTLLPENWRDYLLLDDITYGQKLSDTKIRINGGKLQTDHPELNQALYLTVKFLNPDVVPTVPSSLTGNGVYDIEISFVDNTFETVTETISETMLTVNKAPLSIKVGDTTLTYGDNPATALNTASLSYTGFVNGDTADSMEGTPVFTSGYDEQWKDLPFSGSSYVSVEGLTNPNYDITVDQGTLTFKKLPVQVAPDGPTSKIYGEQDPAGFGMKALNISGYPEPVQAKIRDELDMLAPLTRQAGENVGAYGFELEPYDGAQNFTFQANAESKFYINPRPAEVQWELPDELAYTGSDLSSSVKAFYMDKDGNRVDLTISFSQNGSAATLLEKGDYLAQAVDTSAGRNNYSLSKNTKMVEVVDGGAPGPDSPTEYVTFPTAADISQGSKLKDSALTGGNGGANGKGTYAWKNPDYVPAQGSWSFDVVFTPSEDDPTDYSKEKGYDAATGTVIRQVELTVAKRLALDPSLLDITSVKTYDGTTNAAVSGSDAIHVEPGDDVTITVKATFASSGVGTNIPITVHFELSGADAAKYQCPEDFTVTGEIRPAPLTITANDQTFQYGDPMPTSYAAGRGITADGLVAGETISALAGTLSVDYDGYHQWDDVFSGSKQITVSGLTSNNYEITYQPGTFTVTKRDVLIRPSAANTKVYGDPDPTLQYSLVHALSGTIPESVQKQLSDGVSLGREPGDNTGSYPYLNNAPASINFNFSIDPARSFTITKRTVTLTWYGTDVPYEEDGTDQSGKIRALYEPESGAPVAATLTFQKTGDDTPSAFQTSGFYEVTADLGGNYNIANPMKTVQMLATSAQGVPDPAVKAVTEDSIELNPIENGQYSIDNGTTWQDDPLFDGLTPDTIYPVKQRIPDPDNPGSYLESNTVNVKTPAQEPEPTPPDAPVIADKDDTSITVQPIPDGEYSIDDGNTWQTSPIFDGLTPDTEYRIIQRIPHPRKPDTYLVSEPALVTTDPDGTPSRPNAPVIDGKTHNSVAVRPIPDGEYSIDGGTTWQESPSFTGLTPETAYEVIQRIPDGKGGYLVSDPTSVTTNADPNKPQKPAAPIVDDITSTSVAVRPIDNGEYSIDGGNTWQTSPSFTGLTPDTAYDLIQRIPDGDGGYLVSDPTHITTPSDDSQSDPKVPAPIVESVTGSSIKVQPITNGQYSIDGGRTWQNEPEFTGLTPNTCYQILQRVPSVVTPGNFVVSQPTSATTLISAPEKPEKPSVKDVTDTTIEVRPIPDGEYSIDGGETWQESPIFDGLSPNTEYEIIQRIPDNEGGYIESDPVTVTTKPADDSVADPVVVSKSDSTIILQPIPDGEYSLDGGGTWQKSPAFLGLEPDTLYNVMQRQPAADGYKVSKVVPVRTDKKQESGGPDISINYPDETIDYDPDPGYLVTGPGGIELKPGDSIKPGDTIIVEDKETGDWNEIHVPERPKGPDVSLDTTHETINTKPGMEYSTDGGQTWRPAPDGLDISDLDGVTILVRYPATNGSFSSESTEVDVPKRERGPIISTSPASSATNKDGALIGTGTDMEYSPDGGTTWYPCTSGSSAKLPAGTYQVRYKATPYTLASIPTVAVIGVKRPTVITDTPGGSDSNETPDNKYGHFVQPGRLSGAGQGNPNQTDGPVTTILDGDIALSGMVGCPSDPYTDVDQTQWYHDAVDFTVANRLMIGFTAAEWGPTRNMTRYQMVQVLYRLAGAPKGYTLTGVTDIPNSHWAYKALAWAYSNGIVKGINDSQFAPDAALTYEQMATMIYNFCNLYGLNYVTGTSTTDYDRNEVSDYAQAPMTVLSATGIFNVNGSTHISAGNTMTRAAAAQVITNFCSLYNTQFQTNSSIKGTTQATYTNPGVMDNVTHVLYT